MLSSLYRCLIRMSEKVHDPKRPRAIVLSRRAFTNALALVAFGGVVRPASPRVLPSRVCECDANGQCTGSCKPNLELCNYPFLPGRPAGSNCWCEAAGRERTPIHVCDCICPGAEYPHCVCRTIGYPGCGGGIWEPLDPRHE